MITFDEIKKQFGGIGDDKLRRAYHAALGECGEPVAREYVEENSGSYNSVPLPVVPYSIVSVEDGGEDPLSQCPTARGEGVDGACWRQQHQQVVCTRNYAPPVTVTYISRDDYAAWRETVLTAIRQRVEA